MLSFFTKKSKGFTLISSLDSNFNDLEQYGRRQNLEIHGIHMNDYESIAEVERKVLAVLKKLMKTYHIKILM